MQDIILADKKFVANAAGKNQYSEVECQSGTQPQRLTTLETAVKGLTEGFCETGCQHRRKHRR